MDAARPRTRFWGRVRWWWRAREWRTAVLWAPAVLAATSVAAVAGMCLSLPEQELEARYLGEAKSAYQAKDHARATTCYERVAPNAEDRPEILYRMALTAEAAGDGARAATLIRQLAPDDAKGYAPAHYRRARMLLAVAPQTPRTLAAAEVHLVRALDGELDDRDAVHGLLGTLYLNAGRIDDAEFHLTRAASKNRLFRLPLARTYAARARLARARGEAEVAARDDTRARQEAEDAERFFRERLRADPANVAGRLAWADVVTFLEDFPRAIGILKEGETMGTSSIFRPAVARVYTAWYDVRAKAADVPVGELIALLDRGLSHDPANVDLLNRMIERLRLGGAAAERGRQVLMELLAKGDTALAPIHFALAVDARGRGDGAAEKLHLEQAYRLDPKTGLIANNLAWVLSQPPHADLPRALGLANVAVEREPSNVNYRDTRGRILLSIGRWQEALADLEAVLTKAPATDGLHAALAEVYEKLGVQALAEEHKRLAAASKPGK